MIKYKTKIPTFLFYDYETFGIHTALDKPAQFACIRTDIDLNIIDDPQCFYCYPSDDYLPDPSSVLITQITPKYTQKHGTNEYYFSKKIYNILLQPNTCIIGYNNINFDDEITRNIFYRNFFDPYEWSWKNGNSRWDLINVLRACYALRPSGIKWPKNKIGLISFKLADLTKINNIVHDAHDAIGDVYATIAIAKLIKKKQPNLFNFFLKNRKKNELYKLVNLKKFTPMVYVSSSFGSVRHNISYILPIIWHKNNKNVLIAIDLFKNVRNLIFLCQTVSFDEFFIKNLFDFGIVLLYINRCPILAPIKVIRKEDCNRLDYDDHVCRSKIDLLKKNQHIFKNIQTIFSEEKIYKKSLDVDLQIYSSFFNTYDKKIINSIRDSTPFFLKNINYNFNDLRLNTLFFRYRARNFFHTLNNNEKKIWLDHCFNILNPLSLQKYKDKIECLLREHRNDREKVTLLNCLLDYIIDKYKNLFFKDINLN